jgi:hypothetical protein
VSKPRPVGEILSKVIKDSRLEAGLKRGQALALWPEVVGEVISHMTEAERLEDGTLFVRVQDSVAAHQLTYTRQAYLNKYQQRMPGLVQEIRFQAGRTSFQAGRTNGKSKPKAKKAALPALSADEEGLVRSFTERAPDELKAAIYKAGRAVKQKQKQNPHPPCLICGAADSENPCKSCQRLLVEAVVQKEGQRLKRRPLSERLEGQPLLAAKYLARTGLEAELRDLLPQVVKEPSLMPILQDTAKRYLQLLSGEKSIAKHRNLLPENLRQFLKEI